MGSPTLACRTGFLEGMGKVLDGMGIFVTEAVDDATCPIVLESLGIGSNESVQYLRSGGFRKLSVSTTFQQSEDTFALCPTHREGIFS